MALTEERFLELMKEMKAKQNRDIEEKLVNKLEDVKNEMSDSIRTISERQDKFDNEQTTIKNQMSVLQEQVKDIKKVVATTANSQNKASYAEAARNSIVCTEAIQKEHIDSYGSKKNKAFELLELGMKTLSLQPFSERDVAAELKRSAKD